MEITMHPDSTEVVWFGEYGISQSPREGMIWIEHESGEGMEIPEATFAAAIEQFYADNF